MLRTLSLIGESLPGQNVVPMGNLRELIPLDDRHGVFPNLVAMPLLSTLWSQSKSKDDLLAFWGQVMSILGKNDLRLNAFSVSSASGEKNLEFKVTPSMVQRLRKFDTKNELWGVFGYQTAFGIIRYLLTGEEETTKQKIEAFGRRFLIDALAAPDSSNKEDQKSMRSKGKCAQIGLLHRFCTAEAVNGSESISSLRNAIKANTKFPEVIEIHLETIRCLVPLLHNEAYQLVPYGKGQAAFVEMTNTNDTNESESPPLYWQIIGEALSRRLKMTDALRVSEPTNR